MSKLRNHCNCFLSEWTGQLSTALSFPGSILIWHSKITNPRNNTVLWWNSYILVFQITGAGAACPRWTWVTYSSSIWEKNQDVEINKNKDVQHVMENIICNSLKDGVSTGESDGHDQIPVRGSTSAGSIKSSLPLTSLLNPHKMVGVAQFWENPGPLEKLKGGGDQWKQIMVLYRVVDSDPYHQCRVDAIYIWKQR